MRKLGKASERATGRLVPGGPRRGGVEGFPKNQYLPHHSQRRRYGDAEEVSEEPRKRVGISATEEDDAIFGRDPGAAAAVVAQKVAVEIFARIMCVEAGVCVTEVGFVCFFVGLVEGAL